MKNKIIIALVAVIAWLGQSCETDPAFDFKDDGKIYFKYPKKINDLGIETDLLVDSIVHTVYGKDLPDGKDTLWIQLQIMGARKDFDRNYIVVVVADSSTGKEGVDFDKLADEYIFHRNVGVDSFPLVLNKQAFEKVFNRNVLLKLEPTEDLGIAYVEFSTLKVNFSAYVLEPDWWWAFEFILGEYHPLKYEKVVEVYGSEEIDPYGNNPYCAYVANVVREYFENNIVIDPFTGKRLEI